MSTDTQKNTHSNNGSSNWDQRIVIRPLPLPLTLLLLLVLLMLSSDINYIYTVSFHRTNLTNLYRSEVVNAMRVATIFARYKCMHTLICIMSRESCDECGAYMICVVSKQLALSERESNCQNERRFIHVTQIRVVPFTCNNRQKHAQIKGWIWAFNVFSY